MTVSELKQRWAYIYAKKEADKFRPQGGKIDPHLFRGWLEEGFRRAERVYGASEAENGSKGHPRAIKDHLRETIDREVRRLSGVQKDI